jgi:hypothetical protein
MSLKTIQYLCIYFGGRSAIDFLISGLERGTGSGAKELVSVVAADSKIIFLSLVT